MWSRLVLLSLFSLSAFAQDDTQPVCAANQLFNGQICTCAPGYFSEKDEESARRCEDECEEVYKSWFTYGKCVGKIFDRVKKEEQPACNLRCGVRTFWYTDIGIILVAAAAIATLVFTLPLCFATCCSCIQSRKANKNAKRVIAEQQAAAPAKDQQLATMQYNPYAYWPYYGRT